MEGLESFFTSGQQLQLFVLSCLFGIPIGIVFDVFRVFRMLIRHCKAAVIAEDILFFILYAVFVMCFTITAARSEFRIFYCLGNFLGFLLYFLTVGNIVTSVLKKIIFKIKSVLQLSLKKFVLICGKIIHKFVGSFQNKKIRKKNSKTP
ncbi:MAG: spore cortex biosynthesis protein YabQ [Porcipelethomonas sp.]